MRRLIAQSLLLCAGLVAPAQAWNNVDIPRQVPRSKPKITVRGRQLLVDGTPFHVKGVCWNPIGYGGGADTDNLVADIDFKGSVAQDGDLMKKAGINAVRIYERFNDTAVLDALWERGIFVVMNVYISGDKMPEEGSLADAVNDIKDHPSILFWEVGNEWNYNMLYQGDKGMTFETALDLSNRAIKVIKANDPDHPVASNIGEIAIFDPTSGYGSDGKPYFKDLFNKMPDVDLWGINAYRSIGFQDMFDVWLRLTTDKPVPVFMGEFGADAWDGREGHHTCNVSAQAEATIGCTQQLIDYTAVHGGPTGVVSGGFIFSLADEWWKDGKGSPWMHDVGGQAPGGGPYPDAVFNEEWWGLVDIWRNPRPAYWAYAKMHTPVAGYCAQTGPGGPGGTFSSTCGASAAASSKKQGLNDAVLQAVNTAAQFLRSPLAMTSV